MKDCILFCAWCHLLHFRLLHMYQEQFFFTNFIYYILVDVKYVLLLVDLVCTKDSVCFMKYTMFRIGMHLHEKKNCLFIKMVFQFQNLIKKGIKETLLRHRYPLELQVQVSCMSIGVIHVTNSLFKPVLSSSHVISDVIIVWGAFN